MNPSPLGESEGTSENYDTTLFESGMAATGKVPPAIIGQHLGIGHRLCLLRFDDVMDSLRTDIRHTASRGGQAVCGV